MHKHIKDKDIMMPNVAAETVDVLISASEMIQALEEAYGDDLPALLVDACGEDLINEFLKMAADIESKKLSDILLADPCPHCGAVDGVVHLKTNYELVGDDDSCPEMYQIICDASRTNNANGRSGCGSSSGYKLKIIEAYVLWNTRKGV